MFRNTVSLALQGLYRKKRSSRLVFSVLLISFSFVIVSLSLVGSISKTNAEFRLNNYGEWYFAIPSGQNQDGKWLQRQAWAEAVGTSKNYGRIEIKSGDAKSGGIGFGTLDSKLIDIGRIRLDDGRWPESENEIAIEARTLGLLGYDYTLGQEIVLQIDIPAGDDQEVSAEKAFTVCGIIHEYTNLWMLDHNNSMESLVSAMVTPEAADQWMTEVKSIIPSDSGIDTDAIQPVPQFFISVAPENREQALEDLEGYLGNSQQARMDMLPCENHVAYPEAVNAPPDTFYIGVIAAVTTLAVLCAYIMQLPAEAKSYATLRSIGITKIQLAWLLLTESVLLCVPAVILGIPLGIGLTGLTLRFLMYSGSVPIQVEIPCKALVLVMLLWLSMVLLSRLLVFFVTVRTPLVGRFQLRAAKARRVKRFRSVLIMLLLVAFSSVSVFTVIESLLPMHNLQWWKSCPAYVLWADGPVSQENVTLVEKVPGVTGADGFAEAEAELSFDGIEEQHIWLYAVDDSEWDMTFDFGSDAESFRKGEICLLCLPDDGQGYPLPEQNVTIRVRGNDGAVIACSSPTPVSVRRIGDDTFNRLLAKLSIPYTVICSHSYMERLVSSMEPGTKWDVFSAGQKYGYDRVYVSANMSAQDLSTDVVLAELCANHNIVFSNRRQETTAYIQENTQQLILLYTSGGSVILVLLMILVSAVSLETEQEKRYYQTLRVLGMSKRQMMWDIIKKGLGRSFLAAAAGWIVYLPVNLYSKITIADYTLAEAIRSALQFNGASIGLVFSLSGICMLVILIVCLLGKLSLRKEADQL